MSYIEGLPRQVTVVEVGPRDGLQNEPQVVPTEAKIAFDAANLYVFVRAYDAHPVGTSSARP